MPKVVKFLQLLYIFLDLNNNYHNVNFDVFICRIIMGLLLDNRIPILMYLFAESLWEFKHNCFSRTFHFGRVWWP